MKSHHHFRVYPYRWVIAAVFMGVNLTLQALWICLAPITGPAAKFYSVSGLRIGSLAMLYMVVYIPLSIPVSWIIDRIGFRKAVGIGAVLLGIFGLLRGAGAAHFSCVFWCSIGLAIAQPFMLNAISTVAARWFPLEERASVAGLSLVAVFIGIAIGEVLSPVLMLHCGIPALQMIYGIAAAVSALLFLVFARESPPTPPCPAGMETRALMLDGLWRMVKMKDIRLLLLLFLVGMGVFNGISTWVENILRPRGFTVVQAGDLAGAMLLGGMAGALILPALSDRLHRRKLFLVAGMFLGLPGMLGITFVNSYLVVALSMALVGFSLVGLAPIGYQYAAEITHPAPEGTSNGLLNLAGQASVVCIYAMNAFKGKNGSFTLSLSIMAGCTAATAALMMALRESREFVIESEKEALETRTER